MKRKEEEKKIEESINTEEITCPKANTIEQQIQKQKFSNHICVLYPFPCSSKELYK